MTDPEAPTPPHGSPIGAVARPGAFAHFANNRDPADSSGSFGVGVPGPAATTKPAHRRTRLVRLALLGRVLRGLVVGGSLVAVVVAARRSGLIHGEIALAVAALGALAIPSSTQLSRRIVLVGAITLGWLPMAWWLPAPFPPLGRMTLFLALLYGSLGAWVASASAPRARLSAMMPRLRRVDALPFLAALASAGALSFLLSARTGSRVLTLLMAGWDHTAHYAMTHMIRDFGVVTNMAPAVVNGENTSFTTYPQGFHAAAAAVMELLTSTTVGPADAELVVYAHALAIIIIAAVTSVTAGICALPQLRRRPAVAAPLVAIVTAGFVTGPGSTALFNGFPNFVMAIALVGIVILLVIPLHRVVSPVALLAIGGAVVGIAHNWALLLSLAGVALLALALPLSRTRWRASRSRWVMASAIALATAGAVLSAMRVLSTHQFSALMITQGGAVPPAIGLLLAVVLGSAGLCVAVFAVTSRRMTSARSGAAVRTATLVLVPIVGIAVAGFIVHLQLRASSVVGYYLWKYVVALELACLVLASAAAANLTVALPQIKISRMSRGAVAIASALGVVAASQAFGYAGPSLAGFGVWQGEPTTQTRESLLTQSAVPNPTGERLLAALHVQEQDLTRFVIFLPYPQDNRTHPILAAQWYQSLTGTWTDQRARLAGSPACVGTTADEAAACATAILSEDPTRLIVVGPDVVVDIQERVGPALRGQIIAW
jgi:hypothetical protein